MPAARRHCSKATPGPTPTRRHRRRGPAAQRPGLRRVRGPDAGRSHRRDPGSSPGRSRAGAVQGGLRGSAWPGAVRDPAGRVQGGVAVGPRQLAKAQADLPRAKDASVVDRARAQLDQAKADLGKNQADVARYRPLVKEQAIPQQDLDTAVSREQAAGAGVQAAEAGLKDTVLSQRTSIQLAEAAVEAGKAAVIQADLNLRYTTVQSPISGILSQVAIDTGNLVGKG